VASARPLQIICTSLQTDNHTSISLLFQFITCSTPNLCFCNNFSASVCYLCNKYTRPQTASTNFSSFKIYSRLVESLKDNLWQQLEQVFYTFQMPMLSPNQQCESKHWQALKALTVPGKITHRIRISPFLDHPQDLILSWSPTGPHPVLITHRISPFLDHPQDFILSWSPTGPHPVLITHRTSSHLDHPQDLTLSRSSTGPHPVLITHRTSSRLDHPQDLILSWSTNWFLMEQTLYFSLWLSEADVSTQQHKLTYVNWLTESRFYESHSTHNRSFQRWSS